MQDGKNTSTNAPPFATADGKPTTTSNAKPTDLIASGGTTEAGKGGEFDVTKQSRLQPTQPPSSTPPMQPHMVNRPQQAGSAAKRVNMTAAAQNGPIDVPPTSAPMRPGIQPASGARPPFKGMK